MAAAKRSSSIQNLFHLRLTDSPPALRYGFAIFISLAALIIHHFIWPFSGDIPFFLFYPLTFAVIAIAGFGPACLTISILAVGASMAIMEPKHTTVLLSEIRLTTFVVSSLVLSMVMERNHRIGKRVAAELAANLQRQELLAREQEARQAAEMERSRLRSLVMEAPVVINILRGPQHIIEMTNRKAHELTGGRDFTGLTLREAGPEFKSPDQIKIFDQVYQTGQPWTEKEFRVQMAQADGRLQDRYFNIICQPWRDLDGKIIGIFDFALDVTSQVLGREEAEKASRLKSAFLANMSHEIRTPLGALLGFTDVMREPELTERERNQYLEIMIRNGQQLSRLIDDILDLSKVEAGHLKMEFSQVDPRKLIEEVFDILSVRAKEKNIRLKVTTENDLPDSIVTDATRLKQILLNMIGNAIKFTPFGDVQILMRSFEGESGREYIEFEIIDSGIGIADEQKENIFKVFVQADDSMTRKFGGTGLGLPLSKSLASLLGGDLILKKTEVGRGSTFIVRIQSQPQSWVDSASSPEKFSENQMS